MNRYGKYAALGCLAWAMVGCGGHTMSGAEAPIPSVMVLGRAFASEPFLEVPAGSATASTSNGTDFGEWTDGTLGQPQAPLQRSFQIRNEGLSVVNLASSGPGAEALGPDRALFQVEGPTLSSIQPGGTATFLVGFTGGGQFGPHQATVAVHLEGRDYTFKIAGTSVMSSNH